ncbi:DUF4232 domain-containing protein [Actinacidiphila soli]|jgi:hypothetical protein|uniref:DUF4232 domain-containing protein n=1 Tax=Actinacidiphila soli TaxID=2487275 RepID=UPI000FCC3197|nr:DUF4232 domain-containing protein [Actinacidiphila soli]
MAIFRSGALAAGGAVLVGLLTACGAGGSSTAGAPQTLPGTAGPASATQSGTSATTAATTPAAPAASTGSTSSNSSTSSQTTRTAASGTRCHTSDLRASVGKNDPGAGQENFPVVLTNRSGRTCTVYGYPGAAFVNASGKQVGPDPKRSSGKATTVALAPGASAWAGLTFSNPLVSGAHSTTPAAILITPPDETTSLKVTWSQGAVPTSGNASSVYLTVLGAGTGP